MERSRSLSRVRLQKFVGWLVFVPFSGSLILFMKVFLRYRIQGLNEIRAGFRELTKSKEPLLICSNHLTYIDSVLLIYALGNHWWYLFNFRCLSWNLPAREY